MIRMFRVGLAKWLFDLAARVYPPFYGAMIGRSHDVGGRWVKWEIRND